MPTQLLQDKPTVAMSSLDIQACIGPALVDYAENDKFPDDESVAAANIEDSALPGALAILNNAQTELEVCPPLHS